MITPNSDYVVAAAAAACTAAANSPNSADTATFPESHGHVSWVLETRPRFVGWVRWENLSTNVPVPTQSLSLWVTGPVTQWGPDRRRRSHSMGTGSPAKVTLPGASSVEDEPLLQDDPPPPSRIVREGQGLNGDRIVDAGHSACGIREGLVGVQKPLGDL